jgi:hypothetical protein
MPEQQLLQRQHWQFRQQQQQLQQKIMSSLRRMMQHNGSQIT